MKKLAVYGAILFLCLFGAAHPSEGSAPVLLRAMQDELARSLEKLKLENEARPYYISYLVKDSFVLRVRAEAGAVTDDKVERERTLTITVRVGDYLLDNSHFFSADNPFGYRCDFGQWLSLDDDCDVLRRQIWLETDGAYKSALAMLTKKKAALQHKVRPEALPDFTKGEAFAFEGKALSLAPAGREELAALVAGAARRLLKNDRIQKSNVELEVRRENVYFVNSDGARSVEPRQSGMLTVTAAAQAEDGMPLKNFRSYTFADPAGAPGEERLAGDIDGMVQELMALRSAPVIDEYSGPVLFEKQAAAEVLARGFVRMLAVRRLPETDLSQFEGIFEKADNPLLKKVDAKVMGEAISVKAVPSRSACGGTPLLGSYAVDDEGVRPRELYLVEKGLLKGFLTSRSPVKGFGQSNGHCRGSGPQPSVIEISSAKAAGRGELKERLIAKLQEEGLTYGFIVETILPPTLVSDDLGGFISVTGGSRVSGEFSVSKPVMVRRVHADGREELVRGVCLAPMNVKVFKSIIGVTDEAFVYNYPLDSSGSPYEPGASWRDALSRSYSTVLAPSLLLPEVDLTKPSGDYRKPPIVSYPPAAK